MASITVRKTPRISCSKLGEYMVSSATRRRKIIQDQKWPSDFIVPFYSEAQETIAGFIRRKAQDTSFIEDTIDRLLNDKPTTDWHAQKNNLCIDAMKSFMHIVPQLDLRHYKIRQTGNRQPKIAMAGVEVSVRPELLLSVERNGGAVSAGAIKLCFAKQKSLNDECANYVGALLHEFAYEFSSPVQTAVPRDCIVIDVFAERIHHAPRFTKKRRKEMCDACTEIATMWNSSPEPKDRAAYRANAPKSDYASSGKGK